MGRQEGVLRRYTVPPGLSRQEMFDHWRTWYSSAVETPMRLEPVSHPVTDVFEPRAESLSGRCFSLIEISNGPSAGYWGNNPGCDDVRLVYFQEAPSVRLGVPGGDRPISSGHVRFLDASRAGSFHAPAGMRAVQINVSRAALGVTPADLRRLVSTEGLNSHPLVAALVIPALANWRRPGIARETEGMGNVLVSAMASLVGSVLSTSVRDELLRPTRRRAILDFIAKNYRDPSLDIDAVAAHFDMSRRSLFCLFARERLHLAEHIRALRTVKALEILVDPAASRLPAAAVACAAGFSNAQSLRRALKDATGLTVRDTQQDGALARSSLVRLRQSLLQQD
ncbi:helix-turn-helix domain-containing protein [Sinomonas susongensis]|uniref:helix-turn-helix domain-containing protein n=1 Tax=Sinomonas susongensis TaxID=1324851 RepID=UPI001108B366|nr:helix-turn-helix domain-containing protein [Sinomonas susongensis]